MAPATTNDLIGVGLLSIDEHTLNQLDAQAETGRMHEKHRQHVIRHGHTNAIPKQYNARTGRRDRPRNKLRKQQTRAA